MPERFRMRRPPVKPKRLLRAQKSETIYMPSSVGSLKQALEALPDNAHIDFDVDVDYSGYIERDSARLYVMWNIDIDEEYKASLERYKQECKEYQAWRSDNAAAIKAHEQAREKKKLEKRLKNAEADKRRIERELEAFKKHQESQLKELEKVNNILKKHGK